MGTAIKKAAKQRIISGLQLPRQAAPSSFSGPELFQTLLHFRGVLGIWGEFEKLLIRLAGHFVIAALFLRLAQSEPRFGITLVPLCRGGKAVGSRFEVAFLVVFQSHRHVALR